MGQATFDFGEVVIRVPAQAPDVKAIKEHLEALHTPPSFDEEPPMHRTARQSTLADQMESDELLQPDPILQRVPQKGDAIEVLWAKGWPKLGWTPGTVSDIWYQQSPFMGVSMRFQSFTVWTCYVARADRERNPNIEKGCLWRWPTGRGTN